MTDAFVVLHAGTHTSFWGALEVAFAIAVLVVAVGLVAALLLRARRGTPGTGIAAAFSALESSAGDASADGGRSPLDRPEG